MPLTVCAACRLPSRSVVDNLPCAECRESLLVSPSICADCLGFSCPPAACARPWLRIEGTDGARRFDSVAAAYLAIGPGARVLKSWKTAPSPSLDRFLLAGVRERLRGFSPDEPLALIPVPQGAARKWELAGGSALRVCELVRAARRNPNDRVHELLALGPRAGAQAKAKGDDRYSRKPVIRAREDRTPEEFASALEGVRAVLVDDFLTSGATLRAAAEALRGKWTEVERLRARPGSGLDARLGSGRGFPVGIRLDVFVLGFRPALIEGFG
ncbi:MAG: hypothetical protein JST04_05450 [Bdellovibrionales bacterium]|nr:hypothetical protein [Bdellovibrionales bacterium]